MLMLGTILIEEIQYSLKQWRLIQSFSLTFFSFSTDTTFSLKLLRFYFQLYVLFSPCFKILSV